MRFCQSLPVVEHFYADKNSVFLSYGHCRFIVLPLCVIAHKVALSVVMGECGHIVRVWARVHVCWYVYACIASSVLWALSE